MTQTFVVAQSLDLPLPARPADRPIDLVLRASPEAFRGVFSLHGDRPSAPTLRGNIERAERFLADCSAVDGALREAVEPVPITEIGRQLDAFVAAWPNASGADLAGYGAQLADDVIERRPCRHALREALRHLRQTSRFPPAIAEVLAALDEAQARIRNTAWHVGQIPAELEKARAALAVMDRRAVELSSTRSQP